MTSARKFGEGSIPNQEIFHDKPSVLRFWLAGHRTMCSAQKIVNKIQDKDRRLASYEPNTCSVLIHRYCAHECYSGSADHPVTPEVSKCAVGLEFSRKLGLVLLLV